MKKDIQTFLPITKEQLFRTAIWPHIRKWLLAFVPLGLLLAIMGIGGRMNIFSTIGSILAVGIFLMAFCLPQLLSQYKSLAHIRNMADFDELFRDKQMYWLNGAWGYADEEWFIRVSASHSAALRAGEINFNVPVRKIDYIVKSPGKYSGPGLTLYRMEFAGHDGGIITACSEADRNIINWIRRHGGSMAWDTE